MNQANVNGKKTFIGYLDRIDYTEEMSLEEIWTLFKAILDYQNWQEIWDLWNLKFVWSKIKKEMDADNDKRNETVEKRRQAWKKWGENKAKNWNNSKIANASNSKQEMADSDSVSDSVSLKEEEDKSSSKKDSIPTVADLVWAYESNEILKAQIWDSSVVRKRATYKQKKKNRAYKTIDWFVQQLLVMVNKVRNWQPRWDVKLRLQFAVNQAEENEWKQIVRDDNNDKTENEYQYWKKTLAFTQKQNEWTFT